MKANETHYLSDLFDKVLYMFRTGPLCIQCWDTSDDGQRTCPKHVEYFIK